MPTPAMAFAYWWTDYGHAESLKQMPMSKEFALLKKSYGGTLRENRLIDGFD